ncbi:MAG: Eco57I restriction-modification methylase domain-containing protein [Methanobacteriaceae archaeon]|nr:Eco57I restriction-modification methylase domain-containing protein [Methanobacteriaceae archaeon]
MPEAPEIIKELVNKFERNQEAYKKSSYKEEQIKQEFINPFFKALGWDVDNEQGAAPQYRDVIFEDSIKVSGGTKAPDYCFTMTGRRMFFVEAKKPSVNIEKDIMPSYQLRRYAWSAKLPLSILTDFEEFAIYESRTRPKKTDRASNGRIIYFTYQDYVEKWDEIYNIFSKEAVLKGSFDKYAESTRKKRGTSSVDDEFLGEIEQWREILARNIALRNKELTIEDLNFAVQQIIDRIVFLRMCEDRGVEKYEQLRNLLDNEHIYENFCQLCKKADEKYNSGLFHFKEEKGRGSHPDELTLDLNIDDGVLKTIIKSLYYPNSPYEFSVLPAEILGNVYEQFLGKVIRLTPSHQAKVEKKPEVKKAGGVYYTPQFIVDYIVENTVGTLLKGKTPNKVSEIKILDPACGSGSFLLGAYNYLLKWHLNYYSGQDKKRLSDKLYKGRDDEYHLTIQEKKRILLNNIYGVDIDPQAVEVTKLSLLLKVLEGENKDALESQQKLFQERALPDLENNIKCGNSLIGPDIYELELTSEDIGRINPFDWESEFSIEGFDAVIGNPPYIRIQAMKAWAPVEVEQYKKKYISASKGNYDIYVVFVEKGLELLNDNGVLGFILPHKFFNAKYGEPLRGLIADGQYLDQIVHFGDQQVFERASTYTALLFLKKSSNNEFDFSKVDDLNKWKTAKKALTGNINNKNVNNEEWNFIVGPGAKIFRKLDKIPLKLSDFTEKIFQGLVTSSDPVYLLEPLDIESEKSIKVKSNSTEKEYCLEKGVVHPLCKGSRDIKRYFAKSSKQVLFPYNSKISAEEGKTILISSIDFKEKYPKAWEYLKENEKRLRDREKGKMNHEKWYGYVYPKSVTMFAKTKIITPSIASKSSFTLDTEGNIYFVGSGGGGGGGYGITLKNNSLEDYYYILGLLNSKLLDYYLKQISSTFRGGYYAYNKQYIEKLPIVAMKNIENEKHNISYLAGKMLQLNKDLQTAKTPNSKQNIQRQIEATDKQIDKLVYELYGLTEEEIKSVKESSKN